MKKLNIMLLAAVVACGGSAFGADEERREMKIVVGAAGDDGATFHWVSDDPGFDMQAMQIGESQSIVDESGRAVLVTRQEDGFRFDVDGESIVVPDIGAAGMHAQHVAIVDGTNMTTDIDVEVLTEVGDHTATMAAPMMAGPAGVTILTGEPLDDSTKESIRAVLQSVGRGEDITFVDHGAEGRRVMVVKKQVEVIQ